MPPRVSFEAICSESELNYRPTEKCGAQLEISGLNSLALRSLVTLFDEKAGLFSRSAAVDEKGGFRRERPSPRRTIIALLGLHRLEESGENLPFDLPSMRDVVLEDTRWVRSLGDLGLLTWLTAECGPHRRRNVFDEFNFESAIDKYEDGRQAQTRGIAWFLTGIAHARLAGSQTRLDLTDIAADAYHLLEDNQNESGIFGHAAIPGFLQWPFCHRFGTFSDQIFSIYALVTFAKAFQIEEPLQAALNCGNAIRALQGELGQWWFLYDTRACGVVNRYPVLSSHQYGTAPLGLLALGEATRQCFHESIYKGLSWIAGANELGNDLRSPDTGLIWDSIRRREWTPNYWELGLSLMNIPRRQQPEALNIRYETRPDHLGWLLCAFGRLGLPKGAGYDQVGTKQRSPREMR